MGRVLDRGTPGLFIRALPFSAVSIIPTMFHTLNVSVTVHH